jgi:carbonic anhydrase/acetyltransferase-like protein (isoleucine patch superfamily)
MPPNIHPSCFIHPSAHIIGDVTLERDVSIWVGTLLRGDLTSIYVEEGTNIQDYAVVHVDPHDPAHIGKGCTIGHGAVLHGCRIGDECLVGIKAVVMNGAEIGDGSIIGAGAVVPRNMEVPKQSLVLGTPAKVIKSGDPSLVDRVRDAKALYDRLVREHRAGKHAPFEP